MSNRPTLDVHFANAPRTAEDAFDRLAGERTLTVQAAIDAGMALVAPQDVPDVPCYAIVPKSAELRVLEHPTAPPARIATTATFIEAGSFCRYVKRFALPSTTVFGDRQVGSLLAVLDYHDAPAVPQWGQHRALLSLRQTEAWARWTGQNGRRMNQVEFATFIEDNLPDIATPPGALLLDVARTFEVKRNVAFSSAIRLTDGQHQLAYEETIEGSAQKGAMTIPDHFVLGIAPWEGVEKYQVEARLRYRMQDGKLSLWFDLFRVEDVLRDAFEQVRVFVVAQTGLDVLFGAVAMAEKPAR